MVQEVGPSPGPKSRGSRVEGQKVTRTFLSSSFGRVRTEENSTGRTGTGTATTGATFVWCPEHVPWTEGPVGLSCPGDRSPPSDRTSRS